MKNNLLMTVIKYCIYINNFLQEISDNKIIKILKLIEYIF